MIQAFLVQCALFGLMAGTAASIHQGIQPTLPFLAAGVWLLAFLGVLSRMLPVDRHGTLRPSTDWVGRAGAVMHLPASILAGVMSASVFGGVPTACAWACIGGGTVLYACVERLRTADARAAVQRIGPPNLRS
jgi:hypothetical protein